MIYSTSIGTYQYPRMDVDPKYKLTDEWARNAAKYIYTYHTSSWLQREQFSFDRLRRYAAGRQDINQYRTKFMDDVNNTPGMNQIDGMEHEYITLKEAKLGFTHIDFENIYSPAPNLLNAIQGIMEQQEHAVRIFAQDTYANSARMDMKYRMMVKIERAKFLEEFADIMGQEKEQNLPKSEEELVMYEQAGGFTLPYEVGLQEVINHTFIEANTISDLKNRIIQDFATIRMAASMDVVNPITKRVEAEYVDPADLIIEYSDKENRRFIDSGFWAVQRFLTVAQLREQTGWSEEKILSIATQFNGKFAIGNPLIENLTSLTEYRSNNYCNYNDLRIPILHYEIKTIDSTYYTKFLNSDKGRFPMVEEPYRNDGKKKPRVYDTEKRKTEVHDMETWYVGNWVIGREEVFGYGKKFDIPFDYSKKAPRPSLHFYCLPHKSIIEQGISVFDNMQMANLRFQNDIATSLPANVFAIEIGALNDMQLGNKKIHPLTVLKIATQKGIMFYQMHPSLIPGETQKYNNVKPFEQIPAGVGRAVADFVSVINTGYQQLAALTGIDQFTLNSNTPSSETTATAIKSATASTKDCLKPIYSGWVSIQERIAMNSALVGAQLIVDNDDTDCGYYNIISPAKIIAIKEAGRVTPAELGMKVLAKPTMDEINEVLKACQLAMTPGKSGRAALSVSDYLFIYDELKYGTPVKQIMAYLSYKQQQHQMFELQAQDANQKANFAGAKDVEDNKTRNENDRYKFQTDQDIRKEFAKAYFSLMSQKELDNNKAMADFTKFAIQLGVDLNSMKMGQGAEQMNQPVSLNQMNQEQMPAQ